jgi:putative spermidine/putrescine transport system substrate-binding protein
MPGRFLVPGVRCRADRRAAAAAILKRALTALVLTLAAACRRADAPAPFAAGTLQTIDWAELCARARGTTVRYAMWSGDEALNRFYQGPATATLQQELRITLRIVPLSDTADLVNKLLNEKSANASGSIDLVWINGENFRTARQGGLLWGPFADRLPNIRYFDAAARARDFGTATDGYEAPWQQAQFVFAYDEARVKEPPRSLPALAAWIASHKGRFTYPAIPDFTGSAFIRHVLLHSGGVPPAAFSERFDESLYARASQDALGWLRAIKPHLWRQGATYPATPAEQDRLFVNGEIDFSMNYAPAFASEKIARGEFPASVRTFVLDEGTLSNYSFLAIPFNAPNPAGALAVINHFMSPAHALAHARALGGLFPLLADRLSPVERAAVDALPRGPATLPPELLARKRIPEADAEYLERFERDWRAEVLRR